MLLSAKLVLKSSQKVWALIGALDIQFENFADMSQSLLKYFKYSVNHNQNDKKKQTVATAKFMHLLKLLTFIVWNRET